MSATLVLSCIIEFGTLNRLSVISWKKVRMTSSHHAPYVLGHMCYNSRDKGLPSHEGELTPKTHPQFGLQDATCLYEARIASNHAVSHMAMNSFPGLVHTAEVVTLTEEADTVGRASDWSKVVTG
ncbi:hypothetical protein Sango_3021200 [Sesamum angolense]|uniref:Uncharacterized protein n=1 Tax=Sesamum angolense TaxID=2727404 RepID=A0AAE1T1Y6_9LAMI|nr:hypothetical protein Sango_3021200 [Sesamum angolense]